jgi:long-chain fatty acid transport protein
LGYSYNENPIGNNESFFNIVSPAIYKHIVSVGSSLWLSDSTKLSMAYLHAPANSISGPFYNLAGPIAGTSVTSDVSIHAFVAGLEVRF